MCKIILGCGMVIPSHRCVSVRRNVFSPPRRTAQPLQAPLHLTYIFILMTNAICSAGYSQHTWHFNRLQIGNSFALLHVSALEPCPFPVSKFPSLPRFYTIPGTSNFNDGLWAWVSRILLSAQQWHLFNIVTIPADIFPYLPHCTLNAKREKTQSFFPLSSKMIRLRKWKDNCRTNKNGENPKDFMCN